MGKSSEKQINQIISSPILSNESLLMKILVSYTYMSSVFFCTGYAVHSFLETLYIA